MYLPTPTATLEAESKPRHAAVRPQRPLFATVRPNRPSSARRPVWYSLAVSMEEHTFAQGPLQAKVSPGTTHTETFYMRC